MTTSRKYINRNYQPNPILAHQKTRIDYIASDPIKAKMEIHHQREVTRIIRQNLAKLELKKDMEVHVVGNNRKANVRNKRR